MTSKVLQQTVGVAGHGADTIRSLNAVNLMCVSVCKASQVSTKCCNSNFKKGRGLNERGFLV